MVIQLSGDFDSRQMIMNLVYRIRPAKRFNEYLMEGFANSIIQYHNIARYLLFCRLQLSLMKSSLKVLD